MAGDEVPTRIRLLEAAVEVMAESGWAAVTSRVVADRAQANNALVHYYFGSVDALRRAAVMHAVEKELEGPVEAILQAPDALDGLADAVRALVAHGPGTPGQRVLVEAMLHGLRDEELRTETKRQIRMFRDLLTARLAESQAAGRLRADADAAGLAVLLSALMDGLLMHVLIDPETDAAGSTAGLLALLRPSGAPSGTGGDDDDDDEGDGDGASRQ
ncbi:TetR family transcriptional regulator [Actinomadura darangshiensis]|uniref:TetR family transcriptional regulator n=1 Tax=Actinomadura darangshiensis TaxID=705336 RepID=A0A4R5A3M6_9ACTN|nr:TetR family transcriptional regulator C-terminal domain-containing protein [Actinomadura darangshiensis]TDD66548.1 TetR family transcriptional regulator [Actinomadura darangshiensis]